MDKKENRRRKVEEVKKERDRKQGNSNEMRGTEKERSNGE